MFHLLSPSLTFSYLLSPSLAFSVRYVDDPLTVDGHKLDLRIYVLVTQTLPTQPLATPALAAPPLAASVRRLNPSVPSRPSRPSLRAYVHRGGYVRFATKPYTLDDLDGEIDGGWKDDWKDVDSDDAGDGVSGDAGDDVSVRTAGDGGTDGDSAGCGIGGSNDGGGNGGGDGEGGGGGDGGDGGERKKERKKETTNEASVESAEPCPTKPAMTAMTFDPYVHLTYINTHDSKQHRMQVREPSYNNIFPQYSNIQYRFQISVVQRIIHTEKIESIPPVNL